MTARGAPMVKRQILKSRFAAITVINTGIKKSKSHHFTKVKSQTKKSISIWDPTRFFSMTREICYLFVLSIYFFVVSICPGSGEFRSIWLIIAEVWFLVISREPWHVFASRKMSRFARNHQKIKFRNDITKYVRNSPDPGKSHNKKINLRTKNKNLARS